LRGKQASDSLKIDQNIWNELNEWIKRIPANPSHYSNKGNDMLYFEDSNLNITKLYKNFMSFMFEKTGIKIKLGFVSFYNYFKNNLKYGFKSPKKDICDLCFKVMQIGLSNAEVSLKQEYENHKNKIQEYRTFKNQIHSLNSENLVLEMDYCKTYPVSKLPNSSYYYSSVLNFNLFNIDIHKSDKSYMFYFLEGEFKRGPNSVCSFLFKVINEIMFF
jgi:hypothetical protein